MSMGVNIDTYGYQGGNGNLLQQINYQRENQDGPGEADDEHESPDEEDDDDLLEEEDEEDSELEDEEDDEYDTQNEREGEGGTQDADGEQEENELESYIRNA
jgi:hypothetical protein